MIIIWVLAGMSCLTNTGIIQYTDAYRTCLVAGHLACVMIYLMGDEWGGAIVILSNDMNDTCMYVCVYIYLCMSICR